MLRVYLDNCCYNRPYDDQSQLKISMEAQAKLEIQQQIRDKKLELTVSYILEAENAANPFAAKKTDIQSFIDSYAKVFVSSQMDVEVRKKAAEIMTTGVKLMDACHVACAILADCAFENATGGASVSAGPRVLLRLSMMRLPFSV